MNFQSSTERFSRKYLLLGLAFSAALSLTIAACGDSGASQEEIESARQQGAAKARQQAKIGQIQKELKELKKGKSGSAPAIAGGASPAPEGSPASSSGGSSGNCGASVSANQYTTCELAENVQQAYFEEDGSGSGTVYAYSPTTGQTYSMYCTAGSPHECTGGNNAAVYFP